MPKAVERHIAYYDVHVPHNINFDDILRFQKDFKPTKVIIGGDFGNFEWASHWNEASFKEIGFGRIRHNLMQEFAAMTDLLKRIRAASPSAEITFIPGNHEAHVFWAAQYYPQLGLLPPRALSMANFKADVALIGNTAIKDILVTNLKTDALKIRMLPYNEPLKIGHIIYVHGHQFKSVKGSLPHYPNRNVVFGHFHTHLVTTLSDNGDGQAYQHVAVPCMTPLGPHKPGYLQVKASKWLNGFWIAEVLSNGLFDGRVKKVLGGKHMVD